jgi:hypothetical protein
MRFSIEHNISERKNVIRRKEEVEIFERFGLPCPISIRSPVLLHTSTYQPEAFHIVPLRWWHLAHIVY